MNFDPVAALRQADEERFAAVEQLGQIREQLKNVVDAYHDAYKLAREHGWAASDLARVGFPDPKKYARLRDPKTRTDTRTPPAVRVELQDEE